MRVGLKARQRVFVARHQEQLHPGHGLAGGKGAGKNGEAVGAAHGQESDVRDHEPLHGTVAVAPVHLVRGGGGQDVHSGFALGYEGVYGNGGEHLTVPAAVDGKGVLPDLLAQLLDDPAQIVAVEVPADASPHNLVQQVAVGDAQQRQPDLVHVHGGQWDARAPHRREHVTPPRETDPPRTVRHLHVAPRRDDRPPVDVPKALADGHRVGRAVLKIANADSGIVDHHRMVAAAGLKDDIVLDVALVFPSLRRH